MLKSLTPTFLKRLDAHLLENYPLIWASKLHILSWFTLLLGAFSAVIGLIIPIHLSDRPPYELWYFIFSLVSFVLLCIWVYYYVIFNKEKHYGFRNLTDAYLDFVLVFAAVGLLHLVPYPFELVYAERIAASYSEQEVLADLNTLNENYPYVVDSYNKYKSWTDTSGEKEYFNLKAISVSSGEHFTPYFMSRSGKEFPQLLTKAQVASTYKPDIAEAELRTRIEKFLRTSEKYQGYHKYGTDFYTKRYLLLVQKPSISQDDNDIESDDCSFTVREVLTHVTEAQYHEVFFYNASYLTTLFYLVLSFTTLLTLFKLVRWKQFLLVAVVFIFYPIVTFILTQIADLGGSGEGPFQFWFLVFVVVCFISLSRVCRKAIFAPRTM